MDPFARPVREYMSSPVHAASVDDPLDEVAAALMSHAVSCLPVVGKDGAVAGVISHSDLLQIGHVMAKSVGRKELLTLPAMCAGDLMTTKVVSTGPEATVREASARMREHTLHRLFVLDGGKAIGVLSARDVMRAVIDAKVRRPIAELVAKPILVEATEPLGSAAEKLYQARALGLIVVDGGVPIGLFTQVEALAARELGKDTPVGDACGCSMTCLLSRTPVDRAAGLALATRARRVVALEGDKVAGVLTPLEFAAAALG